MARKHGLLVSAVATVLAAGAWLHPAAAQELPFNLANHDVDAYAFTGSATLNGAALLGGGLGSFSFSSTMCMGVSTDEDTDETHDGGCNLTANGIYTNIVCGTGTLQGNANLEETDNVGDDAYSASFTAVLVAGLGVLEGTASEQVRPGHDGEPETGVVAGVFVVVPNGPGSFPNGCPSSLTVAGAVATTA